VHRSQGKKVDYEVIAADRTPQDLFYVSATRAREGLTVVTGEMSALQESIGWIDQGAAGVRFAVPIDRYWSQRVSVRFVDGLRAIRKLGRPIPHQPAPVPGAGQMQINLCAVA
jgi:ATP-dependent exoDNAse (exonuclease V) alpha subunit